MRFAAKSEKGKRIQNEDYVYIPAGRDDIPLAVVADGMGGHRAGSIASTLAVETLLEELRGSGERWPESRIIPAVRRANEAVYEMSQERPDCRDVRRWRVDAGGAVVQWRRRRGGTEMAWAYCAAVVDVV